MFFGISGFLITYLPLRESAGTRRFDLRKFWSRRVLRLHPALLALVVAVDLFALVVTVFKPGSAFSQAIPATPSVLFYFSNWMIVGTGSAYLGPFGPLWSLSVEEQFYLVWPLVVTIALRTPRPRLVLASVATAGIAAATIHRSVSFDARDLLRSFGTDYRVDMLLVGVVLAIVIDGGHVRAIRAISRALIAPAIVFVLAISVMVPEFGTESGLLGEQIYYTVGLPFVGLSTVAVIGFLVTHHTAGLTRALSWAPLAYTGRISYGLYLWHFPIIFTLGPLGVRT